MKNNIKELYPLDILQSFVVESAKLTDIDKKFFEHVKNEMQSVLL